MQYNLTASELAVALEKFCILNQDQQLNESSNSI